MRTFVVLCLAAVAAAQYEYVPQSGSDVLSAPINPPVQTDFSDPISDYDKEFFSFSAPEGEFDDSNAANKIASAVKKSVRVVFIKGPENAALEDAALKLAKSAADQRTDIYVLNKQADIGDLANKLNNFSKNQNNRPEVHFVKYRTQADAENAQRTIQAQYDALPGSSSTTNGGAVPVLNFASKAPSRSSGSSGSAAAAPSNSYIPPQSSYLPPSRRF